VVGQAQARHEHDAIADKLTGDGVATAHGGKRWYASTVRSILKAS
jgi:hypothetical protein